MTCKVGKDKYWNVIEKTCMLIEDGRDSPERVSYVGSCEYLLLLQNCGCGCHACLKELSSSTCCYGAPQLGYKHVRNELCVRISMSHTELQSTGGCLPTYELMR